MSVTVPEGGVVAEEGAGAGPSRPPWRDLRLVGVVLGVTVFTRLPGFVATNTFNSDEATLAVGGRALAEGRDLYVDVIDRKPPLPFAAYSLVERITPDDLRLVRVLVALLVVATGLVLADEAGRRWGTRAAWVAGIATAAMAGALAPWDAQAANFELFALLPIAVAFVAAARGHAVTAGAALAVAVLCKQPAAVTVVPVAWSLWHRGRVRPLAIAGAAGAVTALVLAAPFGISRVLEWAVLGTGGYLGLGLADLGVAFVRLLLALLIVGLFWAGAWFLLAAPAAPAEPVEPGGQGRTDGHGPARGHADLDVWLLLAASAVGVIAGFRFFPHYLLQLAPAVALLAGRGAARRPGWVRPAAALGLVAVLVATGMAWFTAVGDGPDLPRDLARYVDATTAADDSIYVWGNNPEVYWLADRAPAGGFTHTEFVTGSSGGRRKHRASEADVPDEDLYRTFVRRLQRERPKVVIDTAAAGERGGEWFPIARFPSLSRWLHREYRRVATIDGAPVYWRRDAGPPPSPPEQDAGG